YLHKYFVAKIVDHVRLPICYEQFGQPIVFEVEALDSHAPPWCFGEILLGSVHEILTLDVLIVMVVSLHVENIKIWKTVVVEVGKTGISAPTTFTQAHGVGHILKSVVP